MKAITVLSDEQVYFEGSSEANPEGEFQMLHPGIHPGLMLFEEIADRGLTPAGLARLLGVSTARISRVEQGRAPVTAELALLLGAVFGQSPRFWLAQQAEWDLSVARRDVGDRLAGLSPIGKCARGDSPLN
ncbi:MAG: HigA family addiction module antidote protein [Burkholderiales bacterium]|nr:HigA family addiction module antidote protein [Burkholderiales bacterium]MCL4689572.1 HigA family addiction module antidote protein [Burkholderiales bacterium]